MLHSTNTINAGYIEYTYDSCMLDSCWYEHTRMAGIVTCGDAAAAATTT
jgi:hypothetical protein